MLEDAFDFREAENIFKYTLEDFFKKKFFYIHDLLLNDEEIEALNYIFEKVCNHYPLQYIFNNADFYGLSFYVDENVLIPRPETEELVHLILSENKQDNLKLLDIGTGSGCIAIALKKNRPTWNVLAMDISEDALEVANKNATQNNVEINFIKQDILISHIPYLLSKFDIIVSNPPYIPFNEQEKMSLSTIQHEPSKALFVPNENPLLFYDKIADFALQYLNPKGKLYVELNEYNAEEVKKLLEQKGFIDVVIYNDLADKKRMLSAKIF